MPGSDRGSINTEGVRRVAAELGELSDAISRAAEYSGEPAGGSAVSGDARPSGGQQYHGDIFGDISQAVTAGREVRSAIGILADSLGHLTEFTQRLDTALAETAEDADSFDAAARDQLRNTEGEMD